MDREDATFSDTDPGSLKTINYGLGGACYTSDVDDTRAKGTFSIDLVGTGLAISDAVI